MKDERFDTQKSDHTEEQFDLTSNLSLLNSPEALQKIGSALVKQAIVEAVIAKARAVNNLESLVFNKGEMVPECFQKALKIKVDEQGRAIAKWPSGNPFAYWEWGYIEHHGYLDSWSDSLDSNFLGRFESVVKERARFIERFTNDQLNNAFNKRELAALKQYGLIL